MEVEVVLELAAKLQNVISPHVSQVVTNHLVLPIPNTLASALVVNVIRDKRGMRTCGLAQRFNGRAQSRYLHRIARRSPLPPVAQKAVPEIISDVG